MAFVLKTESCDETIKLLVDGVEVLESRDCLILSEERCSAVVYFPKDCLNLLPMKASSLSTFCPFKGNAVYWHYMTPDCCILNCAWSYPKTTSEVASIEGYIAFDTSHENIDLELPENFRTRFPCHRNKHPNPLVDWLVEGIRKPVKIDIFIRQFFEFYRSVIDPEVVQFNVVVRTLHPQVLGYRYTWRYGDSELKEYETSRVVLKQGTYLNSPIRRVIEERVGVRCEINQQLDRQDYPILDDLAEFGGTDYAAFPLIFSDGQIHFMSIATKAKGGFTVEQMGYLHEALPLLTQTLEISLQQRKLNSLLSIYLGKESGKRVLQGSILRGQVESIQAVIFYSDLRNSTEMSQRIDAKDYLEVLNRYMEALSEPIQDHGGEVLRFIGDAAIAIFPYGKGHALTNLEEASQAAIQAARCCLQSKLADVVIDGSHDNRLKPFKQEVQFGIGLHAGCVLYGNFGTKDRLEFTVLGQAVNEAARIESQCKAFSTALLMSKDVAQSLPQESLKSFGYCDLKGVYEQHELLTLREFMSKKTA